MSRQLIRLRRKAKLTQEALAHEAGLSRTYVTDIEGEKRNVRLSTLEKLAAALDVPIGQLLGSR
ncbi:MAG: helix-turn-helix transcriptional regulator [Hyphomonadaceae bacterium]|nr:helix-turn-helix transcriptional regulator [Hyphomonadaceae bacterium]